MTVLSAGTLTVHAAIDDNLTHLWNFENNLNDVVGGLNGTAIGSTGYSTGKVGGASGDFSGGYVNIASEVIADQQANYTWSAWYRASGTNSINYIVESTPNFAISGSAFSGGTTGTYIEGGAGGAAQYRFLNSSAVANPTGWNLYVVTYDGSLADNLAGTVYLNGAFAGNIASIGSGGDITPLVSTSGLHIGENRNVNSGGAFGGQIDEVAIWNRTLSAAEATTLYNAGAGISLAVPEPASLSLLALGGLTLLKRRRPARHTAR